MSNITYNKTERLRFWCQKVLPIVYDDSLSYYELLNKVVVYLNSTIEDVQAMIEDVTRIEQGLSSKIDVSQKGVVNGVATLDGNGHVPLSQLPDISTGVQTISVNGINVPADDNKNVNIIVMTNAVSNLVNYYLKTETYNKTEVNALIDNVKNSRFEVVAQLPTTDIQTNVIYLVAKSVGQTQNGYDEFININGTTSGWELIGSTDIDLSGYVTDSELATVLNNYVTTQFLNTALAGYVTSIAFNTLVDRVIAVEGKIPSNASSSNQLVDSATLTNGLSGKADVFDVDGWTIDWLQGVGIPDKLYVMEHDEIPQEGTESSGLPNDEAIRKAVGSAYNLMKDTVGWNGKNLLGYKVGKSYNASGVMVDSTHGVISAIIPVSAGDKFIASKKTAISSADSNMMARQFDSNGAFVSSVKALDKADLSGVYTVPSGIAYVGFVQFYNDGTITEDIVNTYEMMLRKADILDPTYEPYRGTTAFPRDEQRILGAKNRCPVPDKTETSRSVTYAMVKKTGIVTANGTVDTGTTSYGSIYNRTNSPLILSPNKYKMKCDFIAQTGVSVTFLCTRNGESYTYGSVNSSNDIIEADVLEGDTIGISIVCSSGTVLDNKIFAPMIWLASDPDDTYVPYAMTNRELTEKANNKIETVSFNTGFSANNGKHLCRYGNVVNITLDVNITYDGTAVTIGTLPDEPENSYAFFEIKSTSVPYSTVGTAFLRKATKELALPANLTLDSHVWIVGSYICV